MVRLGIVGRMMMSVEEGRAEKSGIREAVEIGMIIRVITGGKICALWRWKTVEPV